MKQRVRWGKRNSKIVVILNRYKDSLNDLINSSDLEFLPRLIDKELRNAPKSKTNSIGFLKEDCLDKDVLTLDKSSRLVFKTEDFYLHQCYNIALFGLKSRRP